MPYIKGDRRDELEMTPYQDFPVTPGELNYIITTTILKYLSGRESYTDYNEVIGVLECIKQELYRRMIAPYEDKKIIENGDVYE